MVAHSKPAFGLSVGLFLKFGDRRNFLPPSLHKTLCADLGVPVFSHLDDAVDPDPECVNYRSDLAFAEEIFRRDNSALIEMSI